jgi:hypothetical protein
MGMTAWQRHVHFIQTNQQFYGGRKAGCGDEEQPDPTVRTDQDVLRENYRCRDRLAPLLSQKYSWQDITACTIAVRCTNAGSARSMMQVHPRGS